MTLKTYEFTTDLIIDIEPTQNIRFFQNDHNSAHLVFFITDRKQPVNLTNAKVKIVLQKPDGTIVFQDDCTPIDAVTGKFEVILNTQTLVVDGKAYGQIHIENGDKILECRKFEIFIDRSILSQDAIESTNEFLALQKAIQVGRKLEGIDIDAIVAAGAIVEEVTQSRVDENEVTHPTLKARIDSESSKIGILQKNVKEIYITPEQYGAKGDGISDDYDSLYKCFSEAKNTTIKLKEGATYIVRTFGFIFNYGNLVIEGNNATIKLMDNSGMLTRMLNNTERGGENICFYFRMGNISVKDLNFHANADNNFFVYNGGKYYGYHQDLAVPGIPDKYITTYGVQSYGCDNVTLQNCTFNDFGSGLFIGETWDNGKISRNFLVDGCTFKNGFRDQVVFFQSRNIEIKNCYFYDNQRKAIQFYQNSSNQQVINCEVNIVSSNIRKWHPEWTVTHPDVELGGIGISNVNYFDPKYNCNDTEITQCRFINTKFGASLRHYSKNLKVISNYFENNDNSVFFLNGIRDIVEVSSNKFTNCKNGVNLSLDRHNNIDSSVTATYNAFLTVKGNAMDKIGNLILVSDMQNKDKLYKMLTFIVEDNKTYNGADYFFLNSTRTSSSYQFVDLIQNNNYNETREVVFTGSNLAMRNNKRKGKHKLNTRTIGEKPSAGYDLIKVCTFETTETLTNLFLRGTIYNTSASDAHYSDYVIAIRTNTDISWDSVIKSYTFNRLSNRPANSIRIIEEVSTTSRKIHIYLYVPNSEGQSIISIDNLEEIPIQFNVIFPNSNQWLNGYQEAGKEYISVGSYPDIKTGTFVFNGDGSTISKTIPHGLPGTPSYFHVEKVSVDAGTAGIKYVTADATNINVFFNNAPISGTNNVRLLWKAEL